MREDEYPAQPPTTPDEQGGPAGQAWGQPYYGPAAPGGAPGGYPPGGQYPPYPPYPGPNGGPRRPKMPTAIKVLLAVLLVLAILFASLFGWLFATADRDGGRGDSASSRQRSSSGAQQPAASSLVQNPLPNRGESTASRLHIRSRKGKQKMEAPDVFDKINPSVVGVVATLPAEEGQSGERQGTGIIASSDGLVLTNSHVFGNRSDAKVTVILHNKKQYTARIMGFDKTADLAVLKISATGLAAAEFGDAAELRVGEEALAIGNPDGMDYASTLTGGRVSALDRPIAGHSESGMTYIQTDTAINPGNSGGPLCNLYGQVVGINSNKVVATDYEGMGFAIPVSKCAAMLNQLVSKGYVAGRCRLGIVGRTLSPLQASRYGLSNGVQLLSFDEACSIKDQVQAGDILYELNGQKVSDVNDIAAMLAQRKPGEQLPVKVYAVSKQKTLELRITLLEDKGQTQTTPSAPSMAP